MGIWSTHCHIIFGYIGGYFQLILCNGRIQVLNARQRVHFRLDGGRHKCGEPPGHHFSPECGVHYIEGLQILLVSVEEWCLLEYPFTFALILVHSLVRQHTVDFSEPVQRWIVVC